MNEDQAQHLKSILSDTEHLLSNKYIKGVIEHKTTLNKDYTALELIDMAIDEAIDQVTYLLTIKEVLEKNNNN